MTKRLPSPPAPGPLEDYAVRFDDLFGTLAQRRGFREYLQGLLLPRDRNKALLPLWPVQNLSSEPKVLPPSACSSSSRSQLGMRRLLMLAGFR